MHGFFNWFRKHPYWAYFASNVILLSVFLSLNLMNLVFFILPITGITFAAITFIAEVFCIDLTINVLLPAALKTGLRGLVDWVSGPKVVDETKVENSSIVISSRLSEFQVAMNAYENNKDEASEEDLKLSYQKMQTSFATRYKFLATMENISTESEVEEMVSEPVIIKS